MSGLFTRGNILYAARSFMGVPFQHQGRNRNGLDCIGLVVAAMRACRSDIYERLVEMASSEGRPILSRQEWYSPTYDTNDEAMLLRAVGFAAARSRPVAEAVPGDVLLFSMQGQKTFTGLLAEQGGMSTVISCFTMSRRVNERGFSGYIRNCAYVAHELRGII